MLALKIKILIIVAYYLPGYKFGGPVQSIANLVNFLGDEFEFNIITCDRDYMDDRQYDGVAINQWNTVGKARVYYVSNKCWNLINMVRLINSCSPDLIYLNSFFNPKFTLKPLIANKLNMFNTKRIIIAPRGEFSRGAVSLKKFKKKLYLLLSRFLGLYDNVVWHASNKYEADDLNNILGNNRHVCIAPNLSTSTIFQKDIPIRGKTIFNDLFRVVFLSRISPKKNLMFAINVMKLVKLPIIFDIYGPIDDKGYWQRCVKIIKELPSNIRVHYNGPVTHENVPNVLREYDLFFLPTYGENYGHVITEAMSVGTPVLISDTTPWRNLKTFGVGWDLPLQDPCVFAKCIYDAAMIRHESYQDWRNNVRDFARKNIGDPSIIDDNRTLFMDALNF